MLYVYNENLYSKLHLNRVSLGSFYFFLKFRDTIPFLITRNYRRGDQQRFGSKLVKLTTVISICTFPSTCTIFFTRVGANLFPLGEKA